MDVENLTRLVAAAPFGPVRPPPSSESKAPLNPTACRAALQQGGLPAL